MLLRGGDLCNVFAKIKIMIFNIFFFRRTSNIDLWKFFLLEIFSARLALRLDVKRKSSSDARRHFPENFIILRCRKREKKTFLKILFHLFLCEVIKIHDQGSWIKYELYRSGWSMASRQARVETLNDLKLTNRAGAVDLKPPTKNHPTLNSCD